MAVGPAGFHTSSFFYTDDNGVYYFPTRDSGSLVQQDEDGAFDLDAWLESHKKRIVKLADGRLNLPPAEPYMEWHNTWCVNRPGSTMIIPVADLAQHQLLILCFLVQNGYWYLFIIIICICRHWADQPLLAGKDQFFVPYFTTRRAFVPSAALLRCFPGHCGYFLAAAHNGIDGAGTCRLVSVFLRKLSLLK